MSYAVGYAPVKKNPRIRVRVSAPPGINLTSATYDNPTILYTTERQADGAGASFIANWPISDPTEVCWDVPANWRLTGTLTTLDPVTQQAVTTKQARFSCGKIHVYQDGDGLRMMILTDIKEIKEAEPARTLTKVRGPGQKPTSASAPLVSPSQSASPKGKTKAAEAAEKRAARTEAIAAQSPCAEPYSVVSPDDATSGEHDVPDLP